MLLSEARINSNQRNSALSTGPKSTLGKSRSRMNALKHGLCSTVVVAEDPETVLARAEEIAQTLPAVDGLDGWAAGQVALNSLRIERCQDMEQAVRDRIVSRAEVTWDEDRQLEATLLGGTLAKRPEAVSAQLQETFHGCEWLLGRWAMLARSADVLGSWTPDQTRMAFDLLGTSLEFRECSMPGTSIDWQGQLLDAPQDHAAIARREIEELLERRELLRPLDQANRKRAEADLADDTDPELRRLHRYEATLLRRLQWSLKLLQNLSPSQPSPTEPELKPEPEAKAEAEPTASSEATPTAPKVALPPKRSASRVEKKLIQAEARRETRQRTLDNRRN
jgi:hypothetical protein